MLGETQSVMGTLPQQKHQQFRSKQNTRLQFGQTGYNRTIVSYELDTQFQMLGETQCSGYAASTETSTTVAYTSAQNKTKHETTIWSKLVTTAPSFPTRLQFDKNWLPQDHCFLRVGRNCHVHHPLGMRAGHKGALTASLIKLSTIMKANPSPPQRRVDLKAGDYTRCPLSLMQKDGSHVPPGCDRSVSQVQPFPTEPSGTYLRRNQLEQQA